jgi:hypothetical protein
LGLVQLGVVGYILILFNSFEQSQDNIAKAIGFGGGGFFLAMAAVVMSAEKWGVCDHALHRCSQRGVLSQNFCACLNHGRVVNIFNMFLAFRTEEIITGTAGQEISR